MNSTLNVLITGKYLAGASFRLAQNALTGLKTTASSIGNAFSTLGSKLGSVGSTVGSAFGSAAPLAFNVALGAVLATVGALTIGFNKLQEAIGNAMTRELENIGAINTSINVLGLSEKKASEFVYTFNRQVAELGKTLPTSAENINIVSRTIFDDYAEQLKKAGKSTDEIQKVLLQTSSRAAVLGETANVNVRNTTTALQAFLAGSVSSESGLAQYEFFGKNTLLKNALTSGLKATGKDKFSELDAGQRIKLLNEAIAKALPKDAIDRLSKTSKAQISGFTDALFDPEIGIFSITRDLNLKTKTYESVYTSFQETLSLVIGEKGLLAEITRVLGLNKIDPMVSFKNALDNFNVFIKSITTELNRVRTLDATQLGAYLGRTLARITNFINKVIYDGITRTDWGQVVRTIYNFTMGFIKGYFGTLKLENISQPLVFFVKLVQNPILSLWNTIGNGVKKVLDVINGFVNVTITPLINLVNSITQKVTGLTTALNLTTPSITTSNTSTTANVASGINTVANVASTITNPIGSAVDALSKLGSSIFGANNKHLGHVGFASGGLLSAINSEMKYKPVNSNLVVANDTESILTRGQVQNLITNTYNSGKSSRTVSIGAINLNVTGNTPEQIAMEAIRLIEERLNYELDTRLA